MLNGEQKLTIKRIKHMNWYWTTRAKVLERISEVELQGLNDAFPDMDAGKLTKDMTPAMAERGLIAYKAWSAWMKTDECKEILDRPKKLRYLRNG